MLKVKAPYDGVQHPAVGAWLITDKDSSDLNKIFDLSEIVLNL